MRTAQLAAFALAVALSVPSGMVSIADASQFKRVRDANVSCGDQLTCDLYFSNPSVTLSSVALRRTAAPDAPVQLVLTARDSLSAASTLRFSIDGQPVIDFLRADLTYKAAVYEYTLRDEAKVARYLAAARTGQRLRVEYRTRSGQTAAQFSLGGLDEAIAFMDRAQGRTGQEDSLAAFTDAPPPETPETASSSGPVPPGDVPFAIRSGYYTGDTAACAGTDLGDSNLTGGFAVNLENGARLIALPCGAETGGVQPFALFEEEGRQVRPVAFPVLTDAGLTTASTAGTLQFDGETRELTSLDHADSDTACGTFRRWQIASEAPAAALVLVEQRTQNECGTSVNASPDTWPVVWPLAPTNG